MKATFGAGCFWGIEEAFRSLPGVISTRVGYSGGHKINPTYKEVCEGDTGHAEVVEVEYDPKKITYSRLLDIFWQLHDPTSLNRQGPDVGDQYRSVIFYHNDAQKTEAHFSMIEESKKHKRRIVTEILPAKPFYKAEEYHQCYLQKKRHVS